MTPEELYNSFSGYRKEFPKWRHETVKKAICEYILNENYPKVGKILNIHMLADRGRFDITELTDLLMDVSQKHKNRRE